MPPINFNKFHDALKETIETDGTILQDAIVNGAETLRDNFEVVKTRDKVALLKLDVKDGWAPASDNFDPQEVIDGKSRLVSFREADIDLKVTLSQIEAIYKTYLGWVQTKGRTLDEVNANPFELFFLNHVIQRHFEFVREITAWNGVYNATGKGAASLTDGFLTKFLAGQGVGGDIASSHVFDGAPLTVANAYDQFNGVADLVRDEKPKMLKKALNVYCGQVSYDKYRKNRRTLFKEHVGPADRPTTLDDYSNMNFIIDPGLADSDAIVITPKRNLLFVCNDDAGAYSLNIVKQIKHWELNIRASLDFDYASGELLFKNDQ